MAKTGKKAHKNRLICELVIHLNASGRTSRKAKKISRQNLAKK